MELLPQKKQEKLNKLSSSSNKSIYQVNPYH